MHLLQHALAVAIEEEYGDQCEAELGRVAADVADQCDGQLGALPDPLVHLHAEGFGVARQFVEHALKVVADPRQVTDEVGQGERALAQLRSHCRDRNPDLAAQQRRQPQRRQHEGSRQ
jgi:hypothetical protein